MIVAALSAAQLALGSAALATGSWWTLLSVLALPTPGRTTTAKREADLRLAVIVPAHNEERLIANTVASLRAAYYEPRPRILVVADNCDDETATKAREAGATVFERHDSKLRGKSYALEFALEQLRSGDPVDAVLVVDADTSVSEDFFRSMAAAIASGAEVAQAHYSAGASSSELARLRRLAFSLVHWSRPLGASRLRLPTTLKGNGMAFRWDVVRDGMPGSGITEDAAASLELARRGITVAFVPGATVTGLMAESYAEATVQDSRWEGGRFALVPTAVMVAAQSLLRGQIRSAAAAAELASPPLTIVVGAAGLALVLGIAGVGSTPLAAGAVVTTVGYVAIGLVAARAPREDLAALVHVPRFMLHKLATYARIVRRQPATWERTQRG